MLRNVVENFTSVVCMCLVCMCVMLYTSRYPVCPTRRVTHIQPSSSIPPIRSPSPSLLYPPPAHPPFFSSSLQSWLRSGPWAEEDYKVIRERREGGRKAEHLDSGVSVLDLGSAGAALFVRATAAHRSKSMGEGDAHDDTEAEGGAGGGGDGGGDGGGEAKERGGGGGI